MRFSALAPPLEDPIQLFVNAEAQNRSNPGYPILKRAVFYDCRMISGQYGTVFLHSDYGKIRKCYGLWICTRPKMDQEYTINQYAIQEKQLAGEHRADPAHYDLLTVIVINLGKKPVGELQGLFRLLQGLFLAKMRPSELKRMLADEYAIQLTPPLEKGVDTMCNLSEGLVEDAMQEERQRQEAKQEAREEGRVLAMLRDNVDASFIARYSPFPLERIQELGRANGLLH